MPLPAILGAAAPIAGSLIGGAIGGGGPSNAQPALPKDLQGMRGSNIGLLNYLLGFQQQNQPWSQPQQRPASQGGAIQRGVPSTGVGAGGSPWQVGGAQPQQGMPNFNTTGTSGAFGGGTPGDAGGNALSRLESYFGQLGTPTTDLQRQSLGGISQFLNSNPYGQSNSALQGIMGSGGQDFFGGANRAFQDVGNANYFGDAKAGFNDVKNANYFGQTESAAKDLQGRNLFGDARDIFSRLENYNPFGAAQTSLEGIMGTNPGMQGMEALRPLLDRNLAAANQTGGRFGSSNAILNSRAVDDNNLLAAQMYQRGVDQQIGAAGQYGNIGNSLIGAKNMAGQGMLGVGQGQLSQLATALQGLLGAGQGRLQQGLGAAQGQLGVGQGQLAQGLGAAQGQLGVGQGRSQYALGHESNQIGAASQYAQNQNALFGNMMGGYNTGSQQANQEAQRQQQAIQILSGLLGTSQSATLGGPNVVSPTGAQQGAQFGGGIGGLLALLGGGGGGGSPFVNPGATAPSFGIPYGY